MLCKNGYQKDMCSKEIALCVQNMITILGPIIHLIWGGGGYDHLMSTRIYTFDNKWHHMSSEKREESGYDDLNLESRFANHLVLSMCFMS